MSCGTGLVPLLRSRYRVISLLGEGGFGRTYLAEDVDKLNEQCVVKQLALRIQGSSARQKATVLFYQEAQRLQQLGTNPQIPTLYAYFEENNYLYLVQEFVEGQNLLQELEQQGVFDEQKILSLLNDLLPILQSVHEQQVIHRDIKPQNLMRRSPSSPPGPREGGLVLIDFGVAKQVTATPGTIKPGTNIGTVGYAPIEQIIGGQAYASSDLYSLGATCVHLLTGVAPWSLYQEQGFEWVSTWQQHLRLTVSDKLKLVLNKLLLLDCRQRYQSADEVLRDLNPHSPAKQIPPSPRGNPKFKSGLVVGGTILGLGLAGGLYWQIHLAQTNEHSIVTPTPSSPSSQFEAIADFHSEQIQTQNLAIATGPGMVYNSYYHNSWLMNNPGTSYFEVTFKLDKVSPNASLIMTHLASSDNNVRGDAYSPIAIIVNDKPFKNFYNVTDNHPGSQNYETDTLPIAPLLKVGNNTIKVKFEKDEKQPSTNYWIQKLSVKN
jgi:serine/threonine protein kinase